MKKIYLIFVFVLFVSCSKQGPYSHLKDINQIADQYVRLSLAMGKIDPDYVDAYFGPENLRKDAEKLNYQPKDIISASSELIQSIDELEKSPDSLVKKRYSYLSRLLLSLKTRAEMLSGKKFNFDQESKAIYDAVSPIYNLKIYDDILKQLELIVPGKGNLSVRFEQLRKKIVIPQAKLDKVFRAAIDECRKRTAQHIKLNKNENFTVEYVNNKPWAAYNWFKGNGLSLIQVNDELAVDVTRILAYACHEGYPGHHVFMNLMEEVYFKNRKWVEYSVFPLFSPVAILAEGMANYGIDLTFPGSEKLRFEKSLASMAGINPSDIDLYNQVVKLMDKLSYASNEAARRYLDGNLSYEKTVEWLMKYNLESKERAERSIKFYEKYRAYVITYNVGQELIKSYIERKIEKSPNKDKWQEFYKIITVPTMPDDLKN